MERQNRDISLSVLPQTRVEQDKKRRQGRKEGGKGGETKEEKKGGKEHMVRNFFKTK